MLLVLGIAGNLEDDVIKKLSCNLAGLVAKIYLFAVVDGAIGCCSSRIGCRSIGCQVLGGNVFGFYQGAFGCCDRCCPRERAVAQTALVLYLFGRFDITHEAMLVVSHGNTPSAVDQLSSTNIGPSSR